MALPQSSSSETLTLDSTHIFLNSHKALSQHQFPPPLSLSLLCNHTPLPPIPTNFPQSKLIPNTRFVVDGFRNSGDYSVTYFLSHFHSDHYTGLSPKWSSGIVFCSNTTASLLVEVLGVSSLFVYPLALSQPILIDGCEVSLVDANHCPGAVQFLFKVPGVGGKFEKYVHTGDFRFCESMKLEPCLGEFVGSEAVFLDTTYCNPKFVFPSQDESIDYIVDVIERIGLENKGLMKSVLFLVATYVIGKERILLEISRRCNCNILVDGRKMSVLRVLGYGDGVFTEDKSKSDVHVVGWNVLGETWPYFRPNFVNIKEIMIERGYSKVVGFVPTGWTYEVKRNKFSVRTKDSFEIHLVPYSEHSNYDELREYIKFLRPKRVIPTVGSDIEKLDSKHATAMRKHFAGLVDEMAIKHEFLKSFHRGSLEAVENIEKNIRTVLNEEPSAQKDVIVSKMESRTVLNEEPSAQKDVIFSKMESKESSEPGYLAVSPPSMLETSSRDSILLNDKGSEEVIQELRDCLPIWVTQNQMLDLLSSSNGNVIEAVSNFYERETEFREQVIEHTHSVCTSWASLLNDSASLSELGSAGSSPQKMDVIHGSQSYRSLNIRSSMKSSSLSPGKRKKNLDKKSIKKGKVASKPESGGSKQSTITRFFCKVVSNSSQSGDGISEQLPNDENKLPSEAISSHEKQVEQVLKIINGDESSRGYVSSILKETKGDINMALDIYYSKPEGNLGEHEDRLVVTNQFIQPECSIHSCSSEQDKKILEKESRNMVEAKGLSGESIAATLVSLPPEKYSPMEHACWKPGQPAPYLHLARTFDLVEGEKGKIKATSMLCNMFRSLLVLSPEDVIPAVYLCTNKIAADHENMELNIGGSIVTSAMEEACGTSRSKIRTMYNSLGDLGDVAQLCRQTQSFLARPSPLLIKDVFSVLRNISVQTGSGSIVRKKSLILNLMGSCREKEIKFLVRTLVRNLRIGAMMRTVLPALAQAVFMHSSPDFYHKGTTESIKEKLQCLSAAVVEAYNILPSLDLLIPSLLDKGIGFSSSSLSMIPGIPIKPMLAKITNGVPQALKLFQNKAFTCEHKYDGQRAQIHKLVDGSVRIFSRNGDETTARFPDLISVIRESCKPDALTFILDAEVVAIDRKNGCKLMSFQELSSRERGSKDSLITLDSIKVDICVFVFDIMFANGKQLLDIPLRQRRKYLKDLFNDQKLGYFEYAKETTVEADDASINEATLTTINLFLEEAFRSSCEGIMIKSLDIDAGYSPSKRSDTWLKVKRDYVEGLNDSLDLVPIGAWHGNGRKAGWYSPFLMACYNPDTEEFQSVCRVMSGFSDNFYKEMKEFFNEDKLLSKKPPYYQTAEVPDMWFTPELIWEIRGADFTVSPVHQAAIGLVHPSRGISVRFPRFIQPVMDRRPEECSTAADIVDMFHAQTRKMDVRQHD